MSDPRQTARVLIERDIISLECLRLRYWGNGGSADEFDFEHTSTGSRNLPRFNSMFLPGLWKAWTPTLHVDAHPRPGRRP
jgi:hypothetical protein